MPDVYGNALPHLPVALLVWLATSELRLAVYGMRWVYGGLRFLHIFGVASFFGLLLLIEVKRLGLFAAASLQGARLPIFKLMNAAFALAVLSGIGLFIYDPIGVGLHTMFLPKLALITIGLVHAYGIERAKAMRRPAMRRLSASFALVVWTLVIGASTWNAVERPLNPADVHRADPRQR
jgi:hypothetical protein